MGDYRLRIGMIGAGGIAETRHLPNLKKFGGVRLIAVANRSMESGRRAAEKYGFTRTYAHWKEVVDDPQVEAVFICTPPYLHREISCYALERGKHVFCQARMAMDLDDARAMLEADRRTSLTTMLCPPPHYMNVEPYVIQMLREGGLGDIRHIVLEQANSSTFDPSVSLHWRQRGDLQGINLLEVGIMGEVLNKWFGPIMKVSALGRTWINERPADRDGMTDVDLPDSVSIQGEFQSGATLTALFTSAGSAGCNRLTIYGSKGTLRCAGDKPQVTLAVDGKELIAEVPDALRGEWKVEEEFLQAVAEGRKGSPSFADGFRYMAFTQAVTDSLRQEMKPVRVAEE